jgi:hypothetical protein
MGRRRRRRPPLASREKNILGALRHQDRSRP